MAHKKAGGSSRNGRASQGQRRGVKKFGGELVKAGNIPIRQVGSTFHAGLNVGTGRDFTLFSKVSGHVQFIQKGSGKHKRKYISVITDDAAVSASV